MGVAGGPVAGGVGSRVKHENDGRGAWVASGPVAGGVGSRVGARE